MDRGNSMEQSVAGPRFKSETSNTSPARYQNTNLRNDLFLISKMTFSEECGTHAHGNMIGQIVTHPWQVYHSTCSYIVSSEDQHSFKCWKQGV
jgi:hypothetical protein